MQGIELSSLSAFYRELKKTPRINKEQEYQLAKCWQQQQDSHAAQHLVLSNTYAVAAIAREYRHFQLPEMDLIQEGLIGLMKAIKGFNPDKGFRLMTYANWWVRSAIQAFILHNWRIVKLGTTKLQKRIFSGLKYANEAIAALDPSKAEDVAKQYHLGIEAYQQQTQAWLQQDVSLDADQEGHTLIQQLPSYAATPEESVIHENWQNKQKTQLHQAIKQLNKREQEIIYQRHLQEVPVTLKDIAQDMSISIERVRQLEKKALEKIKKNIIWLS